MPERFPGWEAEWLNEVGDDFTRWRVGGRDAQFFLQRASAAYLDQFTYRHIRKRNHYEHTVEEHELMLYGNRLDALPEILRNRFNSTRDERYKNSKSAPPGPMSGRVDLNTSLHHVMSRLRGEGYLYPGDEGPYSSDSRTVQRTLMTAARLRAYPNVDFGAYTDEDRHQCLLDLPQDLEDCTRVLHNSTGAEIFAVAIWKGSDGRLKFSEAVTPRLSGFAYDTQMRDALHQMLRTARVELAPMLGCTVATAPPAVYGAFDGSFRPRLALMLDGDWVIKRLLADFFDYQWEFQGGKLPIQWPDLDSLRRGDRALVDPERLPDDWPEADLTNPLTWGDLDGIKRMARHIHRSQSNRLPKNRRFQFTRVDDVTFTEWVDTIIPGSQLHYDSASRFFVARMLRREEQDTLARREIAFQLPHPDNVVYSPFTQAFLEDANSRLPEDSNARKLLGWTVEYEQGLPVQASKGIWDLLVKVNPNFPDKYPSDVADVSFLGGWNWQPARVKKTTCDVPAWSEWLHDGHLEHSTSGTMLGGPNGLKWATLELIRIRLTLDSGSSISQGSSQKGKRKGARVIDARGDSEIVNDDIAWLIQRIRESAIQLRKLRTDELPSHSKEVASGIDEVGFHVPSPLKPNKSIVRDSRGPEANYTPSPSPPRKTRPLSGRKKKKRITMEVVIPTNSPSGNTRGRAELASSSKGKGREVIDNENTEETEGSEEESVSQDDIEEESEEDHAPPDESVQVRRKVRLSTTVPMDVDD